MTGRFPIRSLAAGLALLAVASVGPSADGQDAEPARTAPAAAGEVAHLRIEGPLDVGALGLLQRAVRGSRGERDGLVLEIDTPGGRIDTMWKLARQVDEASGSGLLTVAWVNTHAVSAGALVAMACDRIYMRSSGTIGSALPVQIGAEGLVPTSQDPAILEKQLSALRSEFRGWAEAHGRPPALAEAMVDPDVSVRQVRVGGELRLVDGGEWSDLRQRGDPAEPVRTIVREGELLNLTGREAVELGFADGLAETLDEVLEKIGRSGARVVTLERSNSEELASFLDSIKVLLLIAGLVAAYVELKVPGFGIPGLVSILCFALVLTGQYLVGLADVPHIVAVAVGIVLIGVELFLVPGTIWVGALGAVMTLGGLVLALLGPGFDFSYPLDRRLAIDAAWSFTLAFLGAIVAGSLLSRMLPRTPILRTLVLAGGRGGETTAGALPEAAGAHGAVAVPGALGRAVSDLRPVGKIALDTAPDLEFEARADGPAIETGQRLRVVEAHAGRLLVEAAPEGEAAT